MGKLQQSDNRKTDLSRPVARTARTARSETDKERLRDLLTPRSCKECKNVCDFGPDTAKDCIIYERMI